ncbi:MAG: FeoA family protein [bacterium]
MRTKGKTEKTRFLSDLSVGQSAVITGFNLPDDVLLKLMEMGVGAGRTIRYIRKAPLGGPLEVEVLQYHLAIRQSEAQGVKVRAGIGEKNKLKRSSRKGLKRRKRKI